MRRVNNLVTENGKSHTPNDWKLVQLSEVISSLDSGVSVNAEDYPTDTTGYGVLKTSSVANGKFRPNENKKIKGNELMRAKLNPKKGSVIISRANTPELVGEVGYIDKDYNNLYLSDKLWQTSYSQEVDGLWLVSVLSSQKIKRKIRVLASGTSSSMKNISKGNFLSLSIMLPEYKEQREIGKIIRVFDKALELKEKLIEQKKEQKKGLIQTLLRGKMRISEFEGEWRYVPLKEILQVRNEKSVVTEELPLFSLTIEDGVTAKTDRYNREFLVKSDNKKYKISKKGDIVYNPSNLRFGAIALNKIDYPVLLSPIYEVLFIKDKEKWHLELISQLLTSERQIKKFSTKAEGTLIERMAVKIEPFLDSEVFIPVDIKEQVKIAKILTVIERQIDLLNKDLEELIHQKKGLMQLLLTGKVRVKV